MLGIVRYLTFALWLTVPAGLCLCQDAADPWPKPDLLVPAALAHEMQSAKPPTIVCVAFPVLYRSKRILHAVGAGPGSKPEGIESLKQAVSGLAKDADIVIYCGCCPFDRCPNIRPAFAALRDMGFTHLRLLVLPKNFATDWVDKGYSMEKGL